jgi:predicted DNA-binding transcriptional regulator AlpA
MTKKTYTTKEVADIIGVKEREICGKISRGQFPNAKKIPIKYKWEISDDDLKNWLSKRLMTRQT